jgi:hypothetical protein
VGEPHLCGLTAQRPGCFPRCEHGRDASMLSVTAVFAPGARAAPAQRRGRRMSFLRKFKPGARITHFWRAMVIIAAIGALGVAVMMMVR